VGIIPSLALLTAILLSPGWLHSDTEEPASFAERHRRWLEEVVVLLTEEEYDAFVALRQDYRRDLFIERFWRAHDPHPETARNVSKTIKAVRVFVEALNEGKGTIRSLIHDPAVYNDIRDVMSKIKSIAERIDAGEGTLGKFLKNDGIYNELKRMLESFRESGDIARENAAMGSLTSFASLFFNTFN